MVAYDFRRVAPLSARHGDLIMSDSHRTNLLDIADYFKDLDEPRCHVDLSHPLPSVIVAAVMAILAGANGPTAIVRWARTQSAFL